MHVSLDIETLSTSKNAVVLSIGACLFDQAGVYDSFHTTLAYGEQIEGGRDVSPDTVKWWLKQDPEVFLTALKPSVTVREGLEQLEKWLARVEDEHGIEGVWCKGPSFDGAILEDLSEWAMVDCPVGFREWRDVRTIEDLAGKPTFPVDPSWRAHHALDDAILQAHAVRECLCELVRGAGAPWLRALWNRADQIREERSQYFWGIEWDDLSENMNQAKPFFDHEEGEYRV